MYGEINNNTQNRNRKAEENSGGFVVGWIVGGVLGISTTDSVYSGCVSKRTLVPVCVSVSV